MKNIVTSFFLLICLGFTSPILAVDIEFHEFDDPQTERLYLDLIAELRCVKCQNQNLAESSAEIAKDMRDKTYALVTEGKSREDVVNYMTARYGDFVLYKPPFKAATLLLWMGPPILLLFSLYIVVSLVRRQPKVVSEQFSESERESVKNLLKSNHEK